MRKGFYYITAVAILAGIIPGNVIAEDASKAPAFETEILMDVDFDENSAEFVFSTNDDSAARHACEIKDSGMPDMGMALAMKRESSAEHGVYAEMDLGEARIEGNAGKYLIEYDVLTDMLDQWAPYIILGAGENHSKLSVIGADSSELLCSYAPNMNMAGWWACYEHNPVNKVTMTANTRMNVKIVIDTVNAAADYYYNDTYVGTQGSDVVGTAFADGFDKLRFELWSHSDYQPEIFIDNIIVAKILPSVKSVAVVDCSGERKPAAGSVRTVSDTIEISVENLTAIQDFFDTIELTDSNGSVEFTPIYEAGENICTLKLGTNMENGGSYTLKVLGKEFSFTVEYGDKVYISKVALKPFLGNDELKNLDSIGANTPLKAEASAVNPMGEAGTYSITVVCFDGNKMISAKTKTLTLDESKLISSGNLPFAAPAAERLSIKVYAYDNMTALTPLTEGLSLGAPAEPETGDNVFSVSERGTKPNETAVLCLFAPDKTASDIPVSGSAADITGTMVYLQQQKTSEDGDVAFTVKLDENNVSGAYAGYLCTGSIKIPKRIVFVNKDENRAALTLLKASESFAADAKANSAALGFGEYAETVPDSAYSIYADYYSGKTIDETDYELNIKAVHKAELLACINEGLSEDIFDYKDIMDDELSDISGYYGGSYFTETLRKDITAALKEKKLTSLGNLKNNISEAFVLNLVNNPNGYRNITPVLRDFADEIGINANILNDTVSNKICGRLYKNYSELKAAVTEAAAPSKPNGSGNSGGSGHVIGSSGAVKTEPAKEIPETIYSDMPEEHWASEAVVSLTEKGILSGKGGDKFDPDANVTREEFTKMIIAAFFEGEADAGGALPFEDVKTDEWYYPYVSAAYKLRIISGYDDTLFGIGDKISRQDAAVILNRTAALNNYNFSVPGAVMRFEDDSEIALYAADAVYTLKEAGVINGDGGYYNPQAFATRAEAAVIIYNMLSM